MKSSPVPSAVERLNPNPNQGLSSAAAQQRAKDGCANLPSEPLSKTAGQIVRDNLFTFFNLLFLILAVCLFSVKAYTDIGFLIIVVLNVAIGIIQELRVKRVLDRVNLLARRKVMAVRDGQLTELNPEQLVLDDVVQFSTGSQICADSILLTGQLEVNESLLTGESCTILKRTGDNLLSGSFVVSGMGRARLDKVSGDCYAARITQAARVHKHVRSGIMKSLDRWLKILSFVVVPLGLLLFWHQINLDGNTLSLAMRTTVGAVVGMIPEGLYLLVSVALAVSVMGLARSQVLVHELACIENLARVDVLCLDKTGTITAGTLEVCHSLAAPNIAPDRFEQALGWFSHNSVSENATALALKSRFPIPQVSTGPIAEVPFSSERKWASLTAENGHTVVLGAPEMVLPGPLWCERELEDHLAQGHRALLMAYGSTTEGQNLPTDLAPLGLVLLQDQLRPAAAQTLSYFKEQGVTIKVISGDHPAAVSQIAGQAGVENAQRFIDASKLGESPDWQTLSEETTCFGRVSPHQKLDIIDALKAQGHKVAMIGDGVNDVLALKQADCSIAMAQGSQMAQQVSQMVLLDSDFSAMPRIVNEGRRVINNIQRSAALFLIKNIFSFLTVFCLLFLPIAYPLMPLQVSLFSGLMIGAPSFLLTFEPVYKRVKGRFLSGALLSALPGGLTGAFCLLGASWVGTQMGIPAPQLATVCSLLIGIVGLLVLCELCWPFTKMRATLIVVLGICYYGALYLFAPILGIAALTTAGWKLFWIFAPTLPLLTGSLFFLSNKIKKLLLRRDEHPAHTVN